MRTIRIAQSLVTFTFVIITVMAATACTDDRPAVAGQAQATGAAQVEPTGPDHVMVNPAELKWADAPSLPPGAKVTLIEGQLDQPVPFTLRVQFPAGYQLAAHRHPAIEHTTVLSGVVNKARTTAMPAGSITIMQAGTSHYLWTAEGATVQVHGVGPFGITYVNPADDPRTT
jgi:quercetin dioxygenase-like cupin family protein